MPQFTWNRPSRTCFALLLWLGCLVGSAAHATTTLTFDDLPIQPVNGLTHRGITFSFTINGIPSTDANYGSGGPGTTQYIQDPSLEGSADGVLTLDFAAPTPLLQFGVALADFGTLTPGFTVVLFDAALSQFATVPVTTNSGQFFFTEGQFSHSGTPVRRAVITFQASFFDSRFALDNLTYEEGPAGCVTSLNPTSQAFTTAGGNGSVAVAAPTNCSWTAVSNATFLTVTSGSSGAGNGTVGYSVAANTGASSRNGTITIGGRFFTVNQAGTQSGPFLTVTPSVLEFAGVTGGAAETKAMLVTTATNASYTAQATQANGPAGWLSVSPQGGNTAGTGIITQATAGAAASANLGVTVNYSLLTAGTYEGEVTITSGSETARRLVLVEVRSQPARLDVAPRVVSFATAAGGPAPHSKELRVVNSGTASLQWALEVSPTAPWLTLSQTSGSTTPGSTTPLMLTVNPSGLPANVYQTALRFSANAANSPQEVVVMLHVVPSNAPTRVEASPNALVFVGPQGGSALPPQILTVSNVGGNSTTFTLSLPQPSSQLPGISLSQTVGNTALGPTEIQVSANVTGVLPAVYRGKIHVTPATGPVQEVEVVLVVVSSGTTLQRDLPTTAACAPQTLDVVGTTIGNGINIPVSFPRSLLALVVDNCGNLVDNATVVANVEGLSIVLAAVGNGQYAGIWTPLKESASVAVALVAAHPLLGTAQRNYTVATSVAAGGATLPVLDANGVVEGAGLTALRPLAPGSIISIFGSSFASGSSLASSVPLPRSLSGVTVRIGKQDAPLYYVSPGLISAQVPFTAQPGERASIVVNAGGKLTAPQSYLIAPAQPGIFNGAVVDVQNNPAGGGLPVTPQTPARIGHDLIIYSAGLGLVETNVGSGEASPAARTLLPVTATVGGVNVPVDYAGLVPGYVGLYQVVVRLSGSVPTGNNIPVVLRQNGIPSNPNLPIRISIQP